MVFNYLTIGQRVKAIRQELKMSQFALAEKADLSPNYISYIESGQKCMSLESLIRIANAFHVTADAILADCFDNHFVISKCEFEKVIDDCSRYEAGVIIDIAKAVKISLRNNRFQL